MQGKNRSRRGTGHLYQKDDRWYGQWYVRGKRVKRSLGPVRQAGANDGLTQRQAQARMLEAMAASDSAPAPVSERLTVEEVGKRRIRELVRRGRKQDTTLANYESEIRGHFVPHFAERPIAEIGEDDVVDFLDACLNDLAVKTVRNLYVHLNAIFEFAIPKRWCHANPCKLADKPASAADDDTEIRFLDQAELDALLAVPAPRRHSKRTLERAARPRGAPRQGAAPMEGDRRRARLLHRDGDVAVPGNGRRCRRRGSVAGRPRDVSDGGDDGAPPVKTAGAPLARRRLVRTEDPRQRRDEERQAADPEVGNLSAGRSDGRPCWRRARPAVPGLRLPGRRRPRSGTRTRAARSIAARSRSGSSGRSSAPASAKSASTTEAYVRNENGGGASRSERSRRGRATRTSRRR